MHTNSWLIQELEDAVIGGRGLKQAAGGKAGGSSSTEGVLRQEALPSLL